MPHQSACAQQRKHTLKTKQKSKYFILTAMALAPTEHQPEQISVREYNHKKFKLGLRLRQREEENIANITEPQMEEPKKPSKGLFRPYALDENNTPRKRKLTRSSYNSKENYTTPVGRPQVSACNLPYQQQQQPISHNFSSTTSYPATFPSCQTFALNASGTDLHNVHLQSQRAALYMRYMAQIQQHHTTANLQTVTGYPMGYPNVTAPIFKSC